MHDPDKRHSWVAVVGAGLMGCDLALDLAAHDYRVILKDVSEEKLEQARARLTNRARYTRLLKQDRLAPPTVELLARVQFNTDYEGFERADILIENITEDLAAKERLYGELSLLPHDPTLIGINSSCIPITRMARLLPYPERVVGMHFFNPVPLTPVVEVVAGEATSQDTLARTRRFLNNLGKSCVVVRDKPGYAVNRVLMLMINEAIWLVQDQIAEPSDIDTLFKQGLSHKTGPLATADLIGLDTILRSLNVLYDGYHDPKFRPCPLLQQMVDAGKLGQKTGVGFYNYDA